MHIVSAKFFADGKVETMVKIAPSLLSCDFLRMGEEIDEIERAGAEYLHLDVMDGVFVPNFSFGFPIISAAKKRSKMVFDAHLMIARPELYAERMIDAGADIVCAHLEALKDPVAFCKLVRAKGAKAGLGLRPRTPASALFPFLPYVDLVLEMTVEPGFGGQKLIPETLGKITELRREIDRQGLAVEVEADGGINAETAAAVRDAGADILVAGSAVFKGTDKAANIRALRG